MIHTMPRSVTHSRDSFWSDNGDESEMNSMLRNSESRPNSRQSSDYIPIKQTRSRLSDHRKSPKDEKPAWVNNDIENSLPPSDYTITNVNQTHEYMVRLEKQTIGKKQNS